MCWLESHQTQDLEIILNVGPASETVAQLEAIIVSTFCVVLGIAWDRA